MRQYGKPFWSSMPFIRLLLPLITGILVGFYLTPGTFILLALGIICLLTAIFWRFQTRTGKYINRWLIGTCFNLLFMAAGILLVYYHDIRHEVNWIGNHQSEAVFIRLLEPLSEKEKSYKTTAEATAILVNSKWQPANGKLYIYFGKDNLPGSLQYGTQLIFNGHLQEISNMGNPGGFDYKQYCGFQGIYHQVFLRKGDYQLSAELNKNMVATLLFRAQKHVISILKKYIPGAKESGVAEALLIGYRNDLDKALVQSYSNTGVVHIIAISGLHLGMIYGLLILLLKPVTKLKWGSWLKPLIILSVLWAFSLLTGAAASILRSAVMFSFIVIGESIGRRTNIYNTLAASAFCLLLYNPYFLWDVGFQLSYAAVLSIVLLMKPIYKWFYIENKLLNTLWQLNAVTLAAQVLTIPLVLYYFHQFPNLFLFANFIAVPLSGLILYGELVLLIGGGVPKLSEFTGQLISFLIRQMNGYIERSGSLPFAVTDHIRISMIQAIILYLLIAALAIWLLKKQTKAFSAALFFLTLFLLMDCRYRIAAYQQQKIIVYNIPKQTAIDIIEGNQFRFLGDSSLRQGPINTFHLRPARIALGIEEGALKSSWVLEGFIITRRRKVLVIDHWPIYTKPAQKITADIIIFSGNPAVKIAETVAVFNCTQYVFDSSNPLWKIRYWKKEADSLHLRHHSTPEQGAFEADL